MVKEPKVAIIDNSLFPDIYNPVDHWKKFLPMPFKAFRAPEGELPDLEAGFTHFILTGSEASIVERENWVAREVALVKEAYERNLALLGSCYGHQLLALALGGEEYVRRCPHPEVGWIKIKTLIKHSLFDGQEEFFAFSIHFDEVINLRPPFRPLASTEACPVQAMEVEGRRVWGIQSHPEITISEAQDFLKKLVDRGWPHRHLYEQALQMAPQDSGVIKAIIAFFLSH